MTITGIIKGAIKVAVAVFVLWVLASAVMIFAFVGLLKAMGVL